MDLLINIGNTHCEFSDENIENVRKVTTSSLLEDFPLEFSQAKTLFVSSVVPKINEALKKKFPAVHFLSAQNCAQLIDFSEVDATTLGADRIANALAAAELSKLPALVIDCGTCITGEFIDDKKCFKGGFILPGRKLQRQALNLFTGQLPEVDLHKKVLSSCGKNTEEAILAGIDLGIVKAVSGLIATATEENKPLQPSIIITGGDTKIFGGESSSWIERENLFFYGLKSWRRALCC